jgi:group II intron reverse transcriptase/maturase
MSGKALMNDIGESYSGVVPEKQANKGGRPSAEDPEGAPEGRPLAKENTEQSNQCRTQRRENGPNGLERVREVAKKDGKVRFTALLHHVTVDLLRDSYHSLKKKAAPGVDGVTWREYGEGLEGRISDLHGRIHQGAYRAQPSRRTWIPKNDGRKRPLGIAALEDKVVQHAVGRVLNQIWEEDFKGFSYGFRRGRSQHDALDALTVGITRKKVNWVLDLDVRSFFDKVDHKWLVKFVEHRIADRRIVRVIQKWLKAGVMEDGRWFETEEGTPQGSAISPSLANLYLHHILDLWVEAWRKKVAKGDVIVVRYADDAVLGFQYREEAERFLEQLQKRVGKFGLELHPEKTRLIEFGRYATERRAKRGEGKPETFNFLGFTHICGTSRKTGYFTVRRKTIGKRMAAKLKDIVAKLRQRMHEKVRETLKWLQSVVRGYFQYHAVPGNEERQKAFLHEVRRIWLRTLRRRSQRTRWTWKRFMEQLGNLLPPVEIQHPYPTERFDAKHNPRQEPCA